MPTKKKNTLLQGGILAGAGLITKVIGFAYRIPMNNMLGEEGNCLYSVAFGIYGIALTISSYSLPLAVSKLVSTRVANDEYQNVRRVVADALVYALAAGLLAMGVLYFGAGSIEHIYNRPGLSKPLRVLAPTTFVVAILGVFRGYFQGYGDMVPTSLSQILEQIVNAAVSVFATWQFMKAFADNEDAAAYGAAGGTLGTLAGAAVALVFMIVLFYSSWARLQVSGRRGAHIESDNYIYKALFLTIIPIILSQTIYQIGYTLDDLIFAKLMSVRGYADSVAVSLQGVYNTQYNQLINLPVAIATAMASSTLPGIVIARMQKDKMAVRQKITQVIKVNMVIAFPSAVGLAVLASPIMQLMYPRLVTYRHQAVMLLVTGSGAVVFYALSTLTTSILQGNNYMRLPVIHSAVSLGIHVVLLAALLAFTDLNVYALVICNVIFPMIVSGMNCLSIGRYVGYRWKYRDTFWKPLFASLIMGAAAFVVYHGLDFITQNLYVSLFGSVLAAVVVYAVVILRIHCFSREEIKALPGGGRLVKLLHYHDKSNHHNRSGSGTRSSRNENGNRAGRSQAGSGSRRTGGNHAGSRRYPENSGYDGKNKK